MCQEHPYTVSLGEHATHTTLGTLGTLGRKPFHRAGTARAQLRRAVALAALPERSGMANEKAAHVWPKSVRADPDAFRVLPRGEMQGRPDPVRTSDTQQSRLVRKDGLKIFRKSLSNHQHDWGCVRFLRDRRRPVQVFGLGVGKYLAFGESRGRTRARATESHVVTTKQGGEDTDG